MDNAVHSSLNIPVGPRAYINNMGFPVVSDSLHENVIILQETLTCTENVLHRIGMHIDPDKLDIQHFSWRQGDNENPTLFTVLENKQVQITPIKAMRWLGFYFDWKLSFRTHVDILCKKGKSVINGLQCLGNTVVGMNQHHLHLLFKTCVIPTITYGSQLWFNPKKPLKGLLNKLQVVQNHGLRCISGAFRSTLIEILHLLTFIPPILVTVNKLFDSTATSSSDFPWSLKSCFTSWILTSPEKPSYALHMSLFLTLLP
jgi:hypothetical protein